MWQKYFAVDLNAFSYFLKNSAEYIEFGKLTKIIWDKGKLKYSIKLFCRVHCNFDDKIKNFCCIFGHITIYVNRDLGF